MCDFYDKKNIVLLIVLAFIPVSAIAASDYSIFNGFSDYHYDSHAKYRQWGLMDALDIMGFSRSAYLQSSPWQFYENSFINGYRTYTPPQFDSIAGDYSSLTILHGPSGTFWNPCRNEFDFLMDTRETWNGSDVITNNIMRLGESRGYLFDDIYEGHCRYLMLLGSDSMAIGPAMSDNGHPTFSRPDLFNPWNPYHANPFEIWGPTMTNGVRMIMGFTGHSYGSASDREKWNDFEMYWRNGYSIALSFAMTALNAHYKHMPVVMVQGDSEDYCRIMMFEERYFWSSRPNRNDHMLCLWWGAERVRNYDGLYSWNSAANCSVGTISAGLHKSLDSQEAQNAAYLKYLKAFGYTGTVSFNGTDKGKVIHRIDGKKQILIDRSEGNLFYHNADVAAQGPCTKTSDECIEKAASFLVDNEIVAPGEIELDGIVSVNQMAATKEEIANKAYASRPTVVSYIVVFKRDLGDLPILTNDTDTIMIEIGADGDVASLVSTYRHGRTIEQQEPIAAKPLTSEKTRGAFAMSEAGAETEAGYLPTEDGTYIPVYEVTALESDSELSTHAETRYYRMDTLEPVQAMGVDPIGGHDLEPELASPIPLD